MFFAQGRLFLRLTALLVITCLDGRKWYLPKLQKITCHDKMSSKVRVTPSAKKAKHQCTWHSGEGEFWSYWWVSCFWILFSVKIDLFFFKKKKSHWYQCAWCLWVSLTSFVSEGVRIPIQVMIPMCKTFLTSVLVVFVALRLIKPGC